MSFLDDVFRYEDDEPGTHRQAPRRSSFRWLLPPVLISLIGAIGLGVVLRVLGAAVPYPLIFMVLLVIQLLRRTLSWIDPGPIPARLLRAPGGPGDATAGEDGLRLATSRWESRLSWVRLQRDPAQFATTIQPRLVQLVDERLRLRHGVVRTNDPARARALLGEPLWAFMSAPVRENLAPRDLAALIRQMEAL
jgi:hypothetical protein